MMKLKEVLGLLCQGITARSDLTESVSSWNSHRVRKNRLADCPQGIPNDLYAMPQQFGNKV